MWQERRKTSGVGIVKSAWMILVFNTEEVDDGVVAH